MSDARGGEPSNSKPRRSSQWALAALGVAAVTALFGWRQLGPRTTVPGDWLALLRPWDRILHQPPANTLLGDPILVVYPFGKFVNDELQRGRFPLWNPYILAGHPLVSDPGMNLFYPSTLALGWRSPGSAFDDDILIHLLVAAWGTYALIRLWGGGRLGALVGAGVFCGSSAMTVWRLYGNLFIVAAWLPFLLFCFEKSLRGRARLWVAVGGIVFGLLTLGNFIQWTLYDGLLLMAYALTAGALAARRGQRPYRPVLQALAMIGLGLAIGAIQLWPLWELAGLSERTTPKSIDAIRDGTLPLVKLLTVLAPDFFGTPTVAGSTWGPSNYAETTLYWGFLPAILALTAPLWRRDRATWFVWIALLVSGSVMLGAPTIRLFVLVPGFTLFRHERLIYIVGFCGAVLTGLVLEPLFAGARRWRALAVIGGLAALGCAALAAATRALVPPAALAAAGGSVTRAELATAVALVALAAAAWWPRASGAARALLAAAIVLDLASFSLSYAPTVMDERELYPVPGILSRLPRPAVPTRVAPIEDPILLLPDSLMPFDLAELGGYTSLPFHAHQRFLRTLNGGRGNRGNRLMLGVRTTVSPLLDLAGVEYLVTVAPLAGAGPRLELVDSGDGLFLYRNHAVAPRAFITKSVRRADAESVWPELARPDFSYCRFATVEGDGVAGSGAAEEACTGSATIVAYSGSDVSLQTEAPAPGLLVLTDSYYPGWVATVDGVEQAVVRADGIFRGVWLEAGRHDVRFRFRPSSMFRGGVLSLMGLGAATLLLIAARRDRRRSPTASTPSP